MSIVSLGSKGVAATGTIAATSIIPVGTLLLVASVGSTTVGGTVEGVRNSIISVTDACGNTYKKIGEYGDDFHGEPTSYSCGLFMSIVGAQIGTSDRIYNGGIAGVTWAFSLAANSGVILADLKQDDCPGSGNSFRSQTSATMISREHLFFKVSGGSMNLNIGAVTTPTAGFTSLAACSGAIGGGSFPYVGLTGEFRIVTAASATSNPALVTYAPGFGGELFASIYEQPISTPFFANNF